MIPNKSKNIFSDFSIYFFRKPATSTLIRFASEKERENYTHRIMQRLGIAVKKYKILNIHRIGIQAPVRYVFEEMLKWDGNSICWPNHIARVERRQDRLEHINIYFLGLKRRTPLSEKKTFRFSIKPLFILNALRFQYLPDITESDSARYLLYRCSGGYPIGIFAVYVRTPIFEQGEKDQTQFFVIVGFNFWGKTEWSHSKPINKLWEMIHNRVTSNVMHRFKQFCEWRFQEVQKGDWLSSSSNKS